jgi:hypothetical protein
VGALACWLGYVYGAATALVLCGWWLLVGGRDYMLAKAEERLAQKKAEMRARL